MWLKQGNSDPFNSYPIEVNPHINHMIAFARASYFPSLSVVPWLRKEARKDAQGRDPLRFFELGRASPETTVAHITTYGACLLRLLPDGAYRHAFEKTWLELRSQALQTARARSALTLHTKDSTPALFLVRQVLYLFQGDIEARLFSTAKIHVKMLRHLLVHLAPNQTAIFLFLTAMHSTLETACFTLQPAVMTFDNWHPEMWQSLWSNAEALLSPVSTGHIESLPPVFTSPFLRDILLRFRKYLTIPIMNFSTATAPERAQNDLISLWAATRLVDDAAKLLNYFVALTNPHAQYPALLGATHIPPTKGDASLQAGLTLTLFCTIRQYVHTAPLDDTDIDVRDASYVLAPKLQEIIQALLASPSFSREENEERNWRYDEMLFWMYFTGAVFEHGGTIHRRQLLARMREGKGDGDTDGKGEMWWFSHRLARQATRLKVTGWEKARRILAEFAYGDSLLVPDPSEWFEWLCSVGHG